MVFDLTLATAGYNVIFMALILIWTLPWTLKQAKLWNDLKKWYNFLLAGGLLALIPLVAATATGSIEICNSIYYFIEVVAMLLGIVGVLGMCKNLLFK